MDFRKAMNIYFSVMSQTGLPWWLSGKEPVCQFRRPQFDPWVEKIPWRRKWQPTEYSCLGNPMDREAWQAIVHKVAKQSEMIEN